MTDPLLVGRKLMFLRQHLAEIRSRRPDDFATLEADTVLRDALALNLLVVVQEAVDITFHMATDEGWGIPATYREGFEILATRGVIDAPLAAKLAAAAHLRNRIAHGYASLDVERFWSELPDGAAVFEAFAAAIAARVAATAG